MSSLDVGERRGDAPSTEDPVGPLSMESFATLIEDELGLRRGSVTREARLIEDLGLDSLQMLDLMLLLDALGTPLGVESLARIARVGDLHRQFIHHWTLSRQAGRVCESVTGSWSSDDLRRVRCKIVSPQLAGRRTRQRPLRSSDCEFVSALLYANDGALVRRAWCDPNPEEFASELWRNVLLQHLVLDRATDAPIGLVSARDPDMRRGVAYLDFILDPSVHGRGWPFEAAMLFVAHLFRKWPLRKLHAEVLATHVDDLASGLGRLFVEEGRFAAHEYVDGGWVDLHVLSLFRERWERDAPQLLRGLVSGRQPNPIASSTPAEADTGVVDREDA